MPLNIQQKKEIISDLRQKLSEQKGIMLVDFSGVPADEATILRSELRAQNCLLKAVKKSLFQRAMTEEKMDINVGLAGSVSLVFGFDDLITPAKLVYQFSQKHDQLKIVGGIWDNELKDSSSVVALAKLPSYEQAMTQFVWLLNSPTTGLVNVMQGVIRNFMTTLSEIQNKK
jgi:large subunit ribosomal protein L10